MSHDTRSEYRRKANAAGVPFQAVAETYREFRVMDRQERERDWAMRERAWYCVTAHTPASQGFWRHGFQVRFPKAFDGGDQEDIPGFDLIAQTVAEEFPELNNDNDAAGELFAFLSTPHDTLPTAAETWERALDHVMEFGGDFSPAGQLGDDDVPF